MNKKNNIIDVVIGHNTYHISDEKVSLSDLPHDVQNKLKAERSLLFEKWHRNTADEVRFTNKEGTRYFMANRIQDSYQDVNDTDSTWLIKYGKILWTYRINPDGNKEYYWKMSQNAVISISSNGTSIPKVVSTKSEVMDLARKIGTLIIAS